MEAGDKKINDRMENINHKILVLSGKGGVGKSTVAVNLAVALAAAGRKVGLLDVDVHGPSIPKLLGVDGMPLRGTGESIQPIAVSDNLGVMSIAFLLRSSDDAVIWRGPMKYNLIKQFLSDVEWGELDYLIVDSPPGTGDEPLSIVQLIKNADGAVIVTTPQDIALIDVRKCISFCKQLSLPVIGVVENMSGFICPKCGERTDIFKRGGGEEMAVDMGVPFLGRVPIDPGIVSASDEGRPYVANFPDTEAGGVFAAITAPLVTLGTKRMGDTPGDTLRHEHSAPGMARHVEPQETVPVDSETFEDAGTTPESKGDGGMKIAVPLAQGKLSMHFGHCNNFAIFDVDTQSKQILERQLLDAPDHQPGLLPSWLEEKGADLVIAGGMGQRAQALFRQKGIEVLVGAPADEPEAVVRAYLEGSLATGENICDH